MRVLVVGGTGALGRPLIPLLLASGHEVIATHRHRLSQDTAPGARMVELDLLDGGAVHALVRQERPHAIVHLATAIPRAIDPRKIGEQFATTNRLRTEGTRHLLSAAQEEGVEQFIAQGLAFAYEPGDAIRTEQDPIWPEPPAVYAPVADALEEMESMVGRAGGTTLRLGHLYGPGTTLAEDGSMTEAVRRRQMPIIGDGAAWFSFVHVDDVASAVLATLDRPGGGVFNIVDDTPLRLRDWLPWFAESLGAPPPRRLPAWVGRLAVGPFGVTYMTRLAGASNERARTQLGWRPRFASLRDGLRSGPIGASPEPSS